MAFFSTSAAATQVVRAFGGDFPFIGLHPGGDLLSPSCSPHIQRRGSSEPPKAFMGHPWTASNLFAPLC